MKLIKRILGVVTAAALSVTAFSGVIDKNIVSEFFVAEAETASGTCGENVSWELDSEGTLRIFGTGEMDDWWSYNTLWVDENIELSIKKVVIENGVTTICARAFAGCENLTEIIIPESVTSIGNQAFYGCENLTSIEIPNSVTSIGSYAFDYCESLESITIPDSVTSIEFFGFVGCDNLTNIDVSTDNVSYSSISGVLFNKEQTELLKHPAGNIRTKYIIPDSVTSIGYNAFSECRSLTDITIPDSVTSIGSRAFYDCENLTSITIPDSVTEIGGAVFSYCFSLKDVTLSNNITSLKNSDFYGFFDACTSLTSIKIPDSVTSIGYRAFGGCENLTGITIPDSVTGIGEGAFSRCENLTDVYYSGTQEEWNAIEIGSYNECLDNAQIHTIGTMVASGTCGENVSWELDSEGTLRIFGTGEMDDWWSYNTLWVDENIELSIKKVVMENGVTTIGARTFAGCKNLTEIIIPESVTSIKYRAFFGCSNLENITLPSGITCIDEKVFYDCVKLADITIPDGVISIEYGAYYNCESLKSIIIPKSVTKIAGEAFAYCDSLTDIYYNGTQEEWNEISIDDLTKEDLENVTIHFNSTENITAEQQYVNDYNDYINSEHYKAILTDGFYDASMPFPKQFMTLEKAKNLLASNATLNLCNVLNFMDDSIAKENTGYDYLFAQLILNDNTYKGFQTAYSANMQLVYLDLVKNLMDIPAEYLENAGVDKDAYYQAAQKMYDYLESNDDKEFENAKATFLSITKDKISARDMLEKIKMFDFAITAFGEITLSSIEDILEYVVYGETYIRTCDEFTEVLNRATEYIDSGLYSGEIADQKELEKLSDAIKKFVKEMQLYKENNLSAVIEELVEVSAGNTASLIFDEIKDGLVECVASMLGASGIGIGAKCLDRALNATVNFDNMQKYGTIMHGYEVLSSVLYGTVTDKNYNNYIQGQFEKEQNYESIYLLEEALNIKKNSQLLAYDAAIEYYLSMDDDYMNAVNRNEQVRYQNLNSINNLNSEKAIYGIIPTNPNDYLTQQELLEQHISRLNNSQLIVIKCPVNAEVSTPEGELLASLSTGNSETNETYQYLCDTYGDDRDIKILSVLKSDNVEISGADDGEMNVYILSDNILYMFEKITVTKDMTAQLEFEEDGKATLICEHAEFSETHHAELIICNIGDANNDGKINVRDCAFIATALAKGQADTLSSNADYSGDGKINVRDAAAIASALAKGEIN